MIGNDMAKNKSISTSEPPALTTNPFASLAAGLADAGDERDDESIPEHSAPTRAVVSYERKGRGGKEVTLVELRGLGDGELERWLSELRRELGCGGFIDGERIALSGDQRQRLRALLEDRGVGRVSVG
jgi:translation initiation factor 1